MPLAIRHGTFAAAVHASIFSLTDCRLLLQGRVAIRTEDAGVPLLCQPVELRVDLAWRDDG